MSGRYLTDMADVIRGAGLAVVEVSGWQTRARSSGGYASGRPWCVVWHHTASRSSPEGDVSYIINSQDAPLSNLYLARDGRVFTCAAGATNTNGKGGPLTFSRGTVPVDEMNTHAIGVEAANDGVGEPWGAAMVDTYFALSIALTNAYAMVPTDVASHESWSPGRKIDPATAVAVQGGWRPRSINDSGSWSVDDLRAECNARATSAPIPPPDRGGLMFTMFDCLGDTYGGYMDANGIFAQVTWLSPSRKTACENAGAQHIGELSPNDLANCDLLGPVPNNMPRDTFANVIG